MDGQQVEVWWIYDKVWVQWLCTGLGHMWLECGCCTTHLSITGVFSGVGSWGSLRTVM